MMRAPVASARALTSSPPTTRLSLLARARSMPSPSVAIVGPSPAEPDQGVQHELAVARGDQLHEALRAAEHLTVRSTPRRRAPPRPRPPARSCSTPCARACSSSGSQLEPAASPTTSSWSLRSITSSAWVPIDPVDPMMAILRTRMSLGGRPLPSGIGLAGRQIRRVMRFGIFYEHQNPRPWAGERSEHTLLQQRAGPGRAGGPRGLRLRLGGRAPLPGGVLALLRSGGVPRRRGGAHRAHPARARDRPAPARREPSRARGRARRHARPDLGREARVRDR